jgi:hypothetical protein
MAAQIISLLPLAGRPDGAEATDRPIDAPNGSRHQFIASVSKLVAQDYLPVLRSGPSALKAAAFALLRATRSEASCLPVPQRDLQIAIARALLCEAGEQRLDQEEDNSEVDGPASP